MDSPILQGGSGGLNLLGLLPRNGVAVLAIAVLPVLVVLLKRLLFPTFDAREPPVLRPRIPVVGHLIAMARQKSSFYRHLYRERRLPICTLPVLNGKLYVINSPSLISAAMRSKDLSFVPFSVEFSAGAVLFFSSFFLLHPLVSEFPFYSHVHA